MGLTYSTYTHMHTHKRTGTYADTQQDSLYFAVLTVVVKKIPASWNVMRCWVVNSDVWKGGTTSGYLQLFTD